MRAIYFLLICVTILAGGYLSFNPQSQSQLQWLYSQCKRIKAQLQIIAYHLDNYNRRTGEYPSNEQGLAALKTLYDSWQYGSCHPQEYKFFFTPSAILSPWGIPFLYENRGEKPGAFTCSWSNNDRYRHYSIVVSDNVRLYSIGGAILYREYQNVSLKLLIFRIATVIFLGFFIFLYWRSGKNTAVKEPSPANNPGKYMVLKFMFLLMCIVLALFPAVHCIDVQKTQTIAPCWRSLLLNNYWQLLQQYVQSGALSPAKVEILKHELQKFHNCKNYQ